MVTGGSVLIVGFNRGSVLIVGFNRGSVLIVGFNRGSVLIVWRNWGSILIIWRNWGAILYAWGISCRDVTAAETQDTRIETDIVVKQFFLVAESKGWSAFEVMGWWRIWAFEVRRVMFKVGVMVFKMRRPFEVWTMLKVMRWAMFEMRLMMMIEWKMRVWRWVGMQMLMFVIMQCVFFARKESGDSANDSLIWGEMEIHERLEQLLSMLTLCDLEGEQWIHIE